MNLYNEDENENKKGIPVLPRGGAQFKKTSLFGRSPMFSRATGGIMERLKNLSRKDMAFVGIGLGVLVMAPVAEFMMSKPAADNLLTPGFGGREGAAAAGVYEPGMGANSQGSSDGSGEVITPLSSRDPASLILGSQPAQPVMPPVSAPSGSFRDAMKDAGRSAFSEVSKSAGIPTPIPRLSAALRSFGSFFSGGETSRTGGGPDGRILNDSKSASSKSASHSMVGPVANSGYKGVATSIPNSSSKGAYEKLRAQADKSAGNFSGDSAIRSLDKAAADAVDIGKGAGGLGAGGDSDKTTKPSNSTNKNDHSQSGETLDQMAAKQRMQKALDWEFFKKYEIPKMFITAGVEALTGVGKEFLTSNLKTAFGMNGSAPEAKFCWVPAGGDFPNVSEAQAWKDCHTYGARESSIHHHSGGDKETKTGYDTNCPCGESHNPITGVNKADAAGDPPGGTQQASDAAVAALADYDTILKEMITKTAEAEASPKDEKLVVQAAKSVAGGFVNLEGNFEDHSKSPLNILANAKLKATEQNDALNGKIVAIRTKYSGTEQKCGTFDTQVKNIESDFATCSVPPAKMQADTEVVKVKGQDITAQYALDPAKCAKIKKIAADWRKSSGDSLASVKGDIEIHNQAYLQYQKQIGFVAAGIEGIQGQSQQIYTDFGAINPKPADAATLDQAIAGLKAMTGHPQDSAPAAKGAKTPPLRQVADMRAVDWDTLWEKEHKLDSSKATTDEHSKWVAQQNLISTQKETEAPATDLISNYMRSDSLAKSILGRLPDFDRLEKKLASIEAGIAKAKSDFLAEKIDAPYKPVVGTCEK